MILKNLLNNHKTKVYKIWANQTKLNDFEKSLKITSKINDTEVWFETFANPALNKKRNGIKNQMFS